jgi:hypothetical protein
VWEWLSIVSEGHHGVLLVRHLNWTHGDNYHGRTVPQRVV